MLAFSLDGGFIENDTNHLDFLLNYLFSITLVFRFEIWCSIAISNLQVVNYQKLANSFI